MISDREFAAGLFRGVFGQEPPEIVPWNEWAIDVHDNDGTKPLYELDRPGGVLHLNFHTHQRRTWDSERRFVAMLAGKQGGKTVYGPAHTFREIQKRGRGDYLAISATFELFNLKLLPTMKQFFVRDLRIARYWPSSRILELCDPETGEFGAVYSHDHELMWGRIILRSAESEEGLQSATGLWAWLDEAGLYESSVWKDVRARLSLAEGGVLLTTSIYDLGWLKQQIYDPWKQGEHEIDVIQFSSKDSPFFPEAEYESHRRSMQSWQFRMDYDAEFERPPAAIYEDFVDKLRDDGGHKVKRFIIPTEWPRVASIDPGVVNPGKIFAAHDPKEDVYYIYRAEKGGVRRTSKEHGVYDVQRAAKEGERVIWWSVGAKSEKYWREDYKAAGAQGVREPDVSDVEEGIDRGTQLIKQHRVFIFDDLVEFVDEMLRYSRVIKDGNVTKDIKDKATYHLMDAYRYFAVQVVKPRSLMGTKTGAKSYVG